MTSYKGYYLIWNDMQCKWLVQTGYNILGAYDTMQGAKCAITHWSKS